MRITFPRYGGGGRRGGHAYGSSSVGTPLEADHCECGDRRMVIDDFGTCYVCGRFPLAVIRATWAHRARQLDQGSLRLKPSLLDRLLT